MKQYLYVLYCIRGVSTFTRNVELDLEQFMFSFAGDGRSNHLEQEADLTRFQEMEPEVRPLVSQQQDETPSIMAAFGQSGTPVNDFHREYQFLLSNRSGGFFL